MLCPSVKAALRTLRRSLSSHPLHPHSHSLRNSRPLRRVLRRTDLFRRSINRISSRRCMRRSLIRRRILCRPLRVHRSRFRLLSPNRPFERAVWAVPHRPRPRHPNNQRMNSRRLCRRTVRHRQSSSCSSRRHPPRMDMHRFRFRIRRISHICRCHNPHHISRSSRSSRSHNHHSLSRLYRTFHHPRRTRLRRISSTARLRARRAVRLRRLEQAEQRLRYNRDRTPSLLLRRLSQVVLRAVAVAVAVRICSHPNDQRTLQSAVAAPATFTLRSGFHRRLL